MAGSWTDRRRRLFEPVQGLPPERGDELALERIFSLKCSQGDYGAAFEISPYTVMRRERLGKMPPEAAMALEWCASRGRLPTVAEQKGLDDLRAGFAYRAQREALGLTQSELAKFLGVSVSAVRDRENERRAGQITRESALALLIVTDAVRTRQRTTIAAAGGFDALDDATG